MTERAPFLILGAGVSGLAAGLGLGANAIVLERNDRPGGLVRTECWDGYWFDHVLHLLYCSDARTRDRIHGLLGEDLAPCPPIAFVETTEGLVKYPFQMHLGGLPEPLIVRCLRDLAHVTFGPPRTPQNFAEMLRDTFGEAMCETFLYPYNRKMWRRPLDTLAPSGFQWSITHPDFDQVVAGALNREHDFEPYNQQGFYPRPPADAPVRGMELLAIRLAEQQADLRLEHEVVEIDTERRTVTALHRGERCEFTYDTRLISTLPLPFLMSAIKQAPATLQAQCRALTRNRVMTVAFSVRGPRPTNRGLWRYYSDEALCFTRVIYMHEFDPLSSPPEGYGVMAEITQRAEDPPESPEYLMERARTDLLRAGALSEGSEIVDTHCMLIDPGYVVFTTASQAVVQEAQDFLRAHDIEPLGRYGRWEYSSMCQVMHQGLLCADAMLALHAAHAPAPLLPAEVIGG